MRRITLIAVSTLAVLVLLFSYRTSLGDSGSAAAQVVSAPRVVSGTVGSTSTGQGPDPSNPGDQPNRITQPTASPTETADSPTSPAAPPTSQSAATEPSTTATAAAGQSVTVDGSAEMTRYGVVQVRVQITDGKIADVIALQYPQREHRDIEINQVAIPELHDQVIAAQSANIDGVSGATYTTDGYLGSLQSALDAAGFKS